MAAAQKSIRLNTDTGFLKLIAIVCMLIDHIGAVFFPGPNYQFLRIIGRIAFPIFAYCVAVGACYTHSMPKYLLRMLLMALISQPIYVLAMRHVTGPMLELSFTGFPPIRSALLWYGYSLQYCNILFELLLGLLMIWSIQQKKYVFTGAMVLLVWYLNPYLTTSYGWKGVALMVMFYALIDRPLSALFWALGFMLWWGISSGGSYEFLGVRFSQQTFAILALPFIFIPMNTRVQVNKWVFYLFYPLHLLAIYLVSSLFIH